MKIVLLWFRRLVAAVLLLLGAAWIFAEGLQWLLRWRAEKLLADVQSLQVNHSTSAEVQALLNKWSRWGETQTSCREDTCEYFLTMRHFLPTVLRGNADEEANNWLPMLTDLIGLRSAIAGAGFSAEHGVVTAKGFSLMVHLPVRDWFLRGGAYVPDLAVSSSEVSKFRDYEDKYYVRQSHPSRMARSMKGPYGMLINFKPEESAAEKAALMNFQFSCLTQFFPCRSEREILPEGWQMLEERY